MTDNNPSKLAQVLKAGHFAMTAETSPPDSASAQTVLDRVMCLKGVADAVNVTDGASARVHMSALSAAAISLGHLLWSSMRDIWFIKAHLAWGIVNAKRL